MGRGFDSQLELLISPRNKNRLINEQKNMKIIFKNQEVSKQSTFGDVKIDQFFVNFAGNLCQKYCSDSYNIITNFNGSLNSGRFDDVRSSTPIRCVLPEISRIEY